MPFLKGTHFLWGPLECLLIHEMSESEAVMDSIGLISASMSFDFFLLSPTDSNGETVFCEGPPVDGWD